MRTKTICSLSKCGCGQVYPPSALFSLCAPLSQKRWRDGDHCNHIFQHRLYLKELHLRRYRVCTPTLHQRTPEWGTKNKHPSPKHTHRCAHTYTHILSVHQCTVTVNSSGAKSHSSDTGSKPLAKKGKKREKKKKGKITPDSNSSFLPEKGQGMRVEVTRHRATTLPNSRGPTSAEQM